MTPKKSGKKLQKSMGIKNLCLLLILLVIGMRCKPIDNQMIELDWNKRQITVLSNSFVIDSIYVERFGKLYYSKSLINKFSGKQEVSLISLTADYTNYVDSLSVLKCGEDNLDLGVIIRKKGSLVHVTRRIAKGTAHNDEIQTFVRLKYDPCSKRIDTVTTDKVWE